MITEALELVMTNNFFQFSNQYFLQLQGTAMGTPPAPQYANLVYATHKITFIKNHKVNLLKSMSNSFIASSL